MTFTPGTAGQVTLEGTASATNESNTGNNDTSINVQVQTAAPIPTLSTYALLMLSALMGWLLLAQSGRLRRTRR
ncbi:MAG TPA: IPTL-CTERM sorting domain-containing protein [Candidatus Competibacteraceae bacterium]|nr:IPTL-CTERM sorting domain-containing protein [Candidatus Competibacteraceae bacterium]